MDQSSHNARGLTIWFALFSTATVFALLPLTKVSFGFSDPLGLLYILIAYVAICLYCWKRRLFRLAPAFEAVGLGVFMTIPSLVASYMAASVNMPLSDHALALADRAMLFDWAAFIAFIDSQPLLSHTLAFSYSTLAAQLLALPVILGLAGRYKRIYVMILAYGVICYLTCIISTWFPAAGTYAFYGSSSIQVDNINTHYGFAFLADFNAVRESATFDLTVQNADGIITFPSLHAGGALLCAWAAWDLKPLRYPLAIWNGLMMVSAVSHGSHYLVDVVAGLLLAVASILAVTELLHHLQQSKVRVQTPSTFMLRLLHPEAAGTSPSHHV